jgi:hypothetical protein
LGTCLFLFLLIPLHISAQSGSASTDTVSTEISSELLDILLENGVITRDQYNALLRRAERDPMFDLLDQEDDTGYTPVETRPRRFRVRSEDGRDIFRLRGRVYIDGAGLFLDDNKNTVDDNRDGRGELGN